VSFVNVTVTPFDNSCAVFAVIENVPELFSLPYFVSESFLIAPNYNKTVFFSPSSAKLIFTSTLCVLGLFFMFQSIVVNTNTMNQVVSKINDDSLSANVIESSGQFIKNSFTFVYDDITIKFDYHVKFVVSSVEENNDFVIKVNMEIDGKPLMDCDIVVTFTGGEMSDKLSAKFKFKPTDTFNMLVSKNND